MFVDRDHLAAQLSAGKSFEQIGTEAGLHGSTVAWHAKRHGLESAGSARFRARGEPDRELLEALAAAGATLSEIAAAVDRSITTVRYWLERWETTRSPRRGSRIPADPSTAPRTCLMSCRHHGVTQFRLTGDGRYRCLSCRAERVSQWRRRVKRTLIEEAGGVCVACGYDACPAALQFHHVDPARKRFAISGQGVARNLAEARAEANKCILLCANCHAELEAGFRPLEAKRRAA